MIRLVNRPRPASLSPHVTLVGTGQDYKKAQQILAGLHNIKFLEWVKPEELPDLVARHAISLGIFSTTSKGLRWVPNKVDHSMAAGCAVVTSASKPQLRVLGDGAIFTTPGNAESLAETLKNLLTHPDALAAAQRNAREAASRFTPEKVTSPLAAWIRARQGTR